MAQTTMAEFIEKTNFDALRTQKTALINAQASLNAIGGKEQKDIAWELEGLINFLDAFQDIAVDEYGKDTKEVFNDSEEEESKEDATDLQWKNWK